MRHETSTSGEIPLFALTPIEAQAVLRASGNWPKRGPDFTPEAAESDYHVLAAHTEGRTIRHETLAAYLAQA